MKVFERAIRRANIPIVMTKGFNPHPKLSILLALSVGVTGRDEVLELELLRPLSSEVFIECFSQQLPGEIQILSVEILPHAKKSQVSDITYEIIFKDASLLKTLKVPEFLQQSSIVINRVKDGYQKSFNIRPSIQEIKIMPYGLILSVKMTSEGVVRPEEVLQALCKTERKELFEIVRTKVNLSSAN